MDLKEANSAGKSPGFGSDTPSSLTLLQQEPRQVHIDPYRGRKSLWRIEYNFTTLYRLPGVSVETLDSLSHRLMTNKSWFDTYFRTNAVNLEDTSKCNNECRRVQTCAISNVDYAEYQFCVERGDGVTVGGRAYDVITGSANPLSLSAVLLITSFALLSIHMNTEWTDITDSPSIWVTRRQKTTMERLPNSSRFRMLDKTLHLCDYCLERDTMYTIIYSCRSFQC